MAVSMQDDKLIENLLSIPEEDQEIEFKRLSGENVVRKILITIVAMTNADGGYIILGIDDPEKTKLKDYERIFGIEEDMDIYDALGREIQKISPPLSHIWSPNLIKGSKTNKTVAIIHIPKSQDNFRCFGGDVFVRQQKSNKKLTPHEVIQFAYAKGFKKADIELVNVDFSLLDTDYYQTWRNERNLTPEKDIKYWLEQTGLARKESGNLMPTRAAVLLFANYPTTLMETKCAVKISQYIGSVETFKGTPNLTGKTKIIEGPIIKTIKDTHDYVLLLLRTGIKVLSGFVTQYQIPERVIKEAITNAVIHRDYYIKRDIEIKIFEDRVEIESPGLLPYNITPSNIGKVRSEGYRNDLIVKHLRQFPSPPNLDQNEGVRTMRSEMQSQNLYPPVFITYPRLQDSVKVVLLNEKIASEWEKVLFLLQKNKYITNEDARKITRIVQRDKMTRMLKNWVDHGLLLQIKPKNGYVKGTKYRLPNTNKIEND